MATSALSLPVLRRLSDGEWHSSADLARTAGTTRALLARELRELRAAGRRLEGARGRGYRLGDAQPLLDRRVIAAAMGRGTKLGVEVVEQIDSTNTELMRRAPRQDIHRHALAAEAQSAGRGRRGRAWKTIAGASLTFSLGWRFARGAGRLSGLTLAVGLAVARALGASGFANIELKWPNDIMCGDAKLGGILVELAGEARGPATAVIGVGLNVVLPAASRREIDQVVTDLASVSRRRAIDRNRLLARILRELEAMLETFETEGFAPLRAAWQRRHALQKLRVRVLLPNGGSARGAVVGVDADGALVLASGGRRLRFASGEVSLVRR
ncbi:MAG TPA: biotin--[acetyl-CoA-carboxylase] ligase [Casimicrobiaceae bacterium]|nr:biotin--[acetyl-CoA-carboxylase] ligase [Casimicrobiaceae bacterium]